MFWRKLTSVNDERPREGIMKGTGLLAFGSALANIHWLDDGLNNETINELRCSKLFHDSLSIVEFYHRESIFGHSFVVVRTNTGQAFIVHLVADLIRSGKILMYIEITPTRWRPGKQSVEPSNTTVWQLKQYIINKIRRFGSYELGFRDCRHFSRSVANFLSSNNPTIRYDGSYLYQTNIMPLPFLSDDIYLL